MRIIVNKGGKKMKFKILLVATLILFISSFMIMGTTYAQEDFNLRGGVTYTTFSDDDALEGLDSGFGFYVGGEYPLNNFLKVIGQHERYYFSHTFTETAYDGTTYTYDAKINLNAIVGLLSLDLMNEEEISFALMGGPGYYFGKISVEDEATTISLDLEPSFGFKFGAGIDYPMQENLSFNANGFYRILETNLEDTDDLEDGDFSGLEISGGLIYNF